MGCFLLGAVGCFFPGACGCSLTGFLTTGGVGSGVGGSGGVGGFDDSDDGDDEISDVVNSIVGGVGGPSTSLSSFGRPGSTRSAVGRPWDGYKGFGRATSLLPDSPFVGWFKNLSFFDELIGRRSTGGAGMNLPGFVQAWSTKVKSSPGLQLNFTCLPPTRLHT